MKCDIEINVTEEEDLRNVGNIAIPPSLRCASLSADYIPRSNNSESVALPNRYIALLGKPVQNGPTSSNNDISSREQDLTTALKWIKQEIVRIFHFINLYNFKIVYK